MTDVNDFHSAVTAEHEESMNGHEDSAESGIVYKNDTEQSAHQASSLDSTLNPTARNHLIDLVDEVMAAASTDDDFCLTDDEHAQLDAILSETGKSAHGIGAIELYAFKNPKLIPVAFWISSDIILNPYLTESDRDLLIHPETSTPNNDLVGRLWSTEELTKARTKTKAKKFSSLVSKSGESVTDRTLSVVSPSGTRQNNVPFVRAPPRPREFQPLPRPRDIPRLKAPKGLHWRELRSVIEDPDESHGARTEALLKVGLDKAAGIEFNASGSKGIVIYYSRAEADSDLVTHPAHETYLHRAAHAKGAMLASIEARRESLALLPDIANGDSPPNETSATEATSTLQSHPSKHFRLRKCVRIWLKKALGGDAQIPPCMSWYETLWAFCGSFIGLALMFAMNEAFKIASNQQYFLVAGPFGALMMLQYGLTGAPAGQPRSIIFGHAIAGSIGLALTYIPERMLPIWLRMILSPSISIGVMVKLGVPCPPASAHSLIYAEGKHNWKFFGLVMLCSFVSLIPAIAINNLNPKRQYPTFWGYNMKHLAKKMNQRRKRKG
jgi:hypothetical protein